MKYLNIPVVVDNPVVVVTDVEVGDWFCTNASSKQMIGQNTLYVKQRKTEETTGSHCLIQIHSFIGMF